MINLAVAVGGAVARSRTEEVGRAGRAQIRLVANQGFRDGKAEKLSPQPGRVGFAATQLGKNRGERE